MRKMLKKVEEEEVTATYQRVLYEPTKRNANSKAVVFVGGVHGNEPAGYIALQQVVQLLKSSDTRIDGDVYILGGNLGALVKNKRYDRVDLNRLWTVELVKNVSNGDITANDWGSEFDEFVELHSIIEGIVDFYNDRVTFIDLHTTSSPSIPFIPINDTLSNRELALQFPVPTVLGIEEFLDGPLLSYINEIGHIALGFEAGQHTDPRAIDVHRSFALLVLHFLHLAALPKKLVDESLTILSHTANGLQDIFEIRYRYAIGKEEVFSMTPGFSSFSKVAKGQELAKSDGNVITASSSCRVFMPLYQEQGEDGYYLIRKIGRHWLWISRFLREKRMERIMLVLPGVKRINPESLRIKKGIARFFSKELMHLFGYRIRANSDEYLVVSRREVPRKRRRY